MQGGDLTTACTIQTLSFWCTWSVEWMPGSHLLRCLLPSWWVDSSWLILEMCYHLVHHVQKTNCPLAQDKSKTPTNVSQQHHQRSNFRRYFVLWCLDKLQLFYMIIPLGTFARDQEPFEEPSSPTCISTYWLPAVPPQKISWSVSSTFWRSWRNYWAWPAKRCSIWHCLDSFIPFKIKLHTWVVLF